MNDTIYVKSFAVLNILECISCLHNAPYHMFQMICACLVLSYKCCGVLFDLIMCCGVLWRPVVSCGVP